MIFVLFFGWNLKWIFENLDILRWELFGLRLVFEGNERILGTSFFF